MANVGKLVSQRYEVRGMLGRGGTGVVYEAFDTKSRALVALKTIETTAAENLFRLKQEFRALADVQHKNLMRFGELACEGGQWFFTMELVRGKSFIEYVRPDTNVPDGASIDSSGIASNVRRFLGGEPTLSTSPSRSRDEVVIDVGSTLDETRLRASLAQLADVLSALHEAGHVHRDVKPSNVLVTKDGRLVLLDFGLVTALLGKKADQELVGTPAYMAPEQAQGLAVGPEADWYSVGVMLYLALTGALPFNGKSHEIIRAKVVREAPPPQAIAPDAPADLLALCTDLLRMEPSERPTSEAIRARLGLTPLPGSGTFQAAAPVFVGRAAEMKALADAYAEGTTTRARIVTVEGEPGVGKSALVHRFLDAVEGTPLVLSGRCYEQESVPFKGVDSIVDALSEHLVSLSDAEVAAIVEGGARYLATMFPVLMRVRTIAKSVAQGRGVDNETGLREQAFGELEGILDALASRGALVLFLDDVQWADADSVALLRRVLQRNDGAPCLFVATLRTGMDDAPGLAELLASGDRIVVRGLGEEESRALWNALWPMPAAADAIADRDAAMREAAGHPLFLAELARAARAGHGGEHHARLQDVLWQRIVDREPLEQRFLEILAVAGAPTPYEILARAEGLDVGECLTRLGSLKAAQLVRVTRRGDERVVEPYHDRIRESITEHLASSDDGGRALAERHLRLGRALRESTPESALAQRVFAILKHLDAARELVVDPAERRDVAALHLLASKTARLTTAYDKAKHHAREGHALLGESSWRDSYELARDLVVQRMEAEYLAGQSDDARATFEAARKHVTAMADRVALYASWIALETAHGKFGPAIAAGRDILRELGAPLPSKVTMVHVLAQYAANRLAQGRRSIDALLESPTLKDATLESTLRMLMALAPPAFFSDTNLLTWIMLRIAGQSIQHGFCDVSSYGFAGYGMVLAGAFNKHAEGAAFGRLALAVNDRFENESLVAKINVLCGCFIVAWTRPIADAKEALHRAYDAALKHGDTAYEAYAVTNVTIMSYCQAAPPSLLQAEGEHGRHISARRREADMAGVNDALARYAATLRGTTPSAIDLGIEGSSDADFAASLTDATMLARFYYQFLRAELAFLFGQTDRAHALLTEANKGAQGIFGLPTTVELAWLETLVAARQHDSASLAKRARLLVGMASRVRKLSVWAKSAPINFEAHYLTALAELMRVSGRLTAADEAYARAVATARRQGLPKREAIALDLAASHAERRGEMSRAAELRTGAKDAYRRWGAVVLA